MVGRRHTWFETAVSAIPMGTKMIPDVKKVAIATLGERIGRHALSSCCLKAVSTARTAGAARSAKREWSRGGRAAGDARKTHCLASSTLTLAGPWSPLAAP